MIPQTGTGQSAAGFHQLDTFRKCPQKWAYQYRLNLHPPLEKPETGKGTVVHEALRAHYEGRDVEDAIWSLPPRYRPFFEAGLELMRGYLEHYAAEELDVVSVEREYGVRVNGRRFTRRMDLVIRTSEGDVVGIDHKTASRPAARAAWARHDWSLLTQELVGRAIIAPACSAKWGGLILNLIGTGSEQEFLRKRIRFSERALEALPMSIDAAYEEMARYADHDPWRYPRWGQCYDQWGRCDYVPLCENGPGWEHLYRAGR